MTTVTLNPGYFSSRSALDWGFALLALLGTVFAFTRFCSYGCMRITNFVRVGMGVIDPHQQCGCGQLQR